MALKKVTNKLFREASRKRFGSLAGSPNAVRRVSRFVSAAGAVSMIEVGALRGPAMMARGKLHLLPGKGADTGRVKKAVERLKKS